MTRGDMADRLGGDLDDNGDRGDMSDMGLLTNSLNGAYKDSIASKKCYLRPDWTHREPQTSFRCSDLEKNQNFQLDCLYITFCYECLSFQHGLLLWPP